MGDIIRNALKRLTKKSGWDEIKTVLSKECKKADFSISDADYGEMFSEIIIKLS